MKNLETMKTVYSYYFPQVAEIVRRQETVDKTPLFRTQTPIAEAGEILHQLGFPLDLEVPATSEGKIDLDALHEPIIDRIVQIYKDTAVGLDRFDHRYPTAGSSEGIFHYFASLRARGVDIIYTLEGEYEGFGEYAQSFGISTLQIAHISQLARMPKGVFVFSNPSARDGNIIGNDEVYFALSGGHEIAYDLAYAGSTYPHQFDLTHPAISTVFLSMSKPYGLFRFRSGFAFSRTPIPSLYANKWFKHINSLLLSLEIADSIGPKKLAEIYKPIQASFVNQINDETGLGLRTSDALLLAHLKASDVHHLDQQQKELIATYVRGNAGYRFCLTPYFEKVR